MIPSEDAAAGEQAEDGVLAGEVFAWAPEAVGLDGELLVADAVRFADYDLILQPPDGTFSEVGYLPITGFSLAGRPVDADGLNDPTGEGWGAYMRITGSGTTGLSPAGLPTGEYEELSFEIVGFNGAATYGFDAHGNVVVGGDTDDHATLLEGSLIAGSVEFVPTEGEEGLTIEGEVSLAVDEVAPRFAAGRLDVLDLSIVHPPEDYTFTSPTIVQVAATSGTDGVFTAAAAPDDGPHPDSPWQWGFPAPATPDFVEAGDWLG